MGATLKIGKLNPLGEWINGWKQVGGAWDCERESRRRCQSWESLIDIGDVVDEVMRHSVKWPSAAGTVRAASVAGISWKDSGSSCPDYFDMNSHVFLLVPHSSRFFCFLLAVDLFFSFFLFFFSRFPLTPPLSPPSHPPPRCQSTPISVDYPPKLESIRNSSSRMQIFTDLWCRICCSSRCRWLADY